jgi:hypothetical protein
MFLEVACTVLTTEWQPMHKKARKDMPTTHMSVLLVFKLLDRMSRVDKNDGKFYSILQSSTILLHAPCCKMLCVSIK